MPDDKERRECALPECRKLFWPDEDHPGYRNYCSEDHGVLGAARRLDLKQTEKEYTAKLKSAEAVREARSERMKKMHKALTPEERAAKMAHLRELRKEKLENNRKKEEGQ